MLYYGIKSKFLYGMWQQMLQVYYYISSVRSTMYLTEFKAVANYVKSATGNSQPAADAKK